MTRHTTAARAQQQTTTIATARPIPARRARPARQSRRTLALPCPASDTTTARVTGDALDTRLESFRDLLFTGEAMTGEAMTGAIECPWCQALARAPRTLGSLTRICALHARQVALQGAYDAAHEERPDALVLLAYGDHERAYTLLADDALDLYTILAMALAPRDVPPLDVTTYHEWRDGDPIPALHIERARVALARIAAARAGRPMWIRTVRHWEHVA